MALGAVACALTAHAGSLRSVNVDEGRTLGNRELNMHEMAHRAEYEKMKYNEANPRMSSKNDFAVDGRRLDNEEEDADDAGNRELKMHNLAPSQHGYPKAFDPKNDHQNGGNSL